MGNSVSLSKTPQAKDDFAATSEDSTIIIDALANDLGGNAKSLYSLDQNNPLHVATTALSQFGATITLVDGKIFYDPTGSAQLQALGSGQTVIDTFSYAIRLGNGTLSIATVQITVNGAAEPVLNHAPVAGPIANQSIAEDHTLNFALPAGTFSDPDHDALSYTAKLAGGAALPTWLDFDAGTQTFSGTPPQDFNGFFDIRVTASDGPLSASSDFRLTITPDNKAPAITLVVFDVQHPVIGPTTGSISGSLSFTDADLTDMHTISVTPGSNTGYVGTFTATPHTDSTGGITGLVDLNFVVNLADVPSAHPQSYTVTVDDGRGGKTSTVVTIPFGDGGDGGGGGGGGGHLPVIFVAAGDSDGITVVDNVAISPHIRQGTLSFSDEDIQDSHFATAIVSSLDPSGAWGTASAFVSHDTTGSGTGGKISWNYLVTEFPKVQALGFGESHFEKITVALDSPGEHVTHDVMVRIVGSNDAPIVQPDTLVGNVSGSWTAAGGPVALQFAQAINFSDADLHDHHTASATINAAHTTVDFSGSLSLNVTDTLNGLGGRVNWTFDLDNSSMPYIPGHEGEQRKVTYDVTIDDGHGGVTVPFVLIFNSPPVIPGDATTQMDVTSPAVAGNLGFSEVDPDHHVIKAHFDQGHSSGDGPLGTFDFSVLNDVSSGTGGLTHWEYHVSQAARDTLVPGQTWVDSFVATFDDGHGGIASHLFSFTLHGPDLI